MHWHFEGPCSQSQRALSWSQENVFLQCFFYLWPLHWKLQTSWIFPTTYPPATSYAVCRSGMHWLCSICRRVVIVAGSLGQEMSESPHVLLTWGWSALQFVSSLVWKQPTTAGRPFGCLCPGDNCRTIHPCRRADVTTVWLVAFMAWNKEINL